MATKHPYLAFAGIIVFSVGFIAVIFSWVDEGIRIHQIAPGLIVLVAGILILFLWSYLEKRP